MEDAKIKQLRNYISLTIAKIVGSLVIVIGLLWAFTNSVNQHDDILFWVSVVTGTLIPIIVLWLVVDFGLNLRHFINKFNA